MFARQSVELPQSTYLALREHLRRNGSANDISFVLVAAVDLWLAQQHEAAGAYGYQWKTVFLPDGTVLRSSSYGAHDYAHVKGDQIIYEGRAISPNQLAQSFARSTRNAWNDLFIRRPGDKTFKQACVLRQEIACEEQALRQARLAAACPRAPAVAPSPALTPAGISRSDANTATGWRTLPSSESKKKCRSVLTERH